MYNIIIDLISSPPDGLVNENGILSSPARHVSDDLSTWIINELELIP